MSKWYKKLFGERKAPVPLTKKDLTPVLNRIRLLEEKVPAKNENRVDLMPLRKRMDDIEDNLKETKELLELLVSHLGLETKVVTDYELLGNKSIPRDEHIELVDKT